VVRGGRGNEPSPRVASSPLAIPTPEELGIGPPGKRPAAAPAPARPIDVDWSATRRALRELGAVRFQLEQLPGGRARFAVWLPAAAGPRLVQADGDSEALAVSDCLARARGRDGR
jgi:hypothetical protein